MAIMLTLQSLKILAYVATRIIYLLKFHPASKFPGPKLAAVSNIPYAYHWFVSKPVCYLQQIHSGDE
jgi:hypothetical protein